MKASYLGLRAMLEPALNVGPLNFLGSTVTSGPNGTGSRGLLELYRVWTEGNIVMAEFRLGLALVAATHTELIDLIDTQIRALNTAFGGRINTACVIGGGVGGGSATLKEVVTSSIESFSNNATQSTVTSVKAFLGASIEVKGLA